MDETMAGALQDAGRLDAALPGVEAAAASRSVSFTGSGSEYFRIWIVNLALTLVTLGIYSAWAKVRRLQYFHRNTHLAGASFDYHGDPRAILKGRLVAFGMFGLLSYGGRFSPWLGIASMLVTAAFFPWLMRQGARFRAHNTSYRGLRFGFDGSVGALYRMYGIPFVLWLAALVLMEGDEQSWRTMLGAALLVLVAVLMPFLFVQYKRYLQGNVRYGRTAFVLAPGYKPFLKVFVRAFLLLLVLIPVIALPGIALAMAMPASKMLLAALLPALLALSLYGLVSTYVFSRIHNVLWSSTRVGAFGFEGRLSARALFKVWAVNILLLVVTLGLYWPFAAIRATKLKLESVSLLGAADLDAFAAHAQAEERHAIGEEAAALFDMDISL